MRRRLTWNRLWEEAGDAGLVCCRCHISAPTLRKWVGRYRERGEAGLVAQSRRPKTSPRRKVFEQEESWSPELRRERNFGARRIQQELRRRHRCHLGPEAIHRVLKRHEAPPLRQPKRPQPPLRYSASLPGERAQMDRWMAPGLYQYAVIDDCTRYLVGGALPPPDGRQHPRHPGADLRRDRVPHPAPADGQRHGIHGL